MLTPAFELSQDETFLILIVRVPFAKVSETEIFIEENEVKFYSQPYYLCLTLPGNVIEDGRETAQYEAESGSFTIRIPKEVPGQWFEGLDMLTKLLAPKGESSASLPVMEVLGEDISASGDDTLDDATMFEDFDWQYPQKPFVEEAVCLNGPTYGFANRRHGVFKRLQEEMLGIIDLSDPDSVTVNERSKLMTSSEKAHFDEDHYLFDLFQNDDQLTPILSYQPVWYKYKPELPVEFSEEEKERMMQLPRKQYLLDKTELVQVLLALIDIVYAFAYNHRTTEGESTVESAWTIKKISSTLSWLGVHQSIQNTVLTSFRRSLCFPLFRNWDLSRKVLKDTLMIFKSGRNRILKCLLEIHKIFANSDLCYILNDLYITDYCVWVQSVSEKQIASVFHSLKEIKVNKSDVDLDLVELEQAAKMVQEEEEEEESDGLAQGLAQVSLNASSSGRLPSPENDQESSSLEESDTTEIGSDESESESDSSAVVSNDESDSVNINSHASKKAMLSVKLPENMAVCTPMSIGTNPCSKQDQSEVSGTGHSSKSVLEVLTSICPAGSSSEDEVYVGVVQESEPKRTPLIEEI
ncbi:protein SHQ1 homolog [Lingula anatina]|uniref:Protein SHQ1 homolog n=1 Tax=Lingula anatina TaxID=7574 RepID=A0A1S3JWM7_LINAN|nr:protein SHQ1 homolog [Lingula anatina]|eukprot:XP_013414830.1 protein SHQ1 homolog [Lingula anatina]